MAACDARLPGETDLDVEPAAKLGRDRRDVVGRDRLGLDPEQPPDHVIGIGRTVLAIRRVRAGRRAACVVSVLAAANRHLGRMAGTNVEHAALEVQGARDGQVADADQLVARLEPGGFGRAPGCTSETTTRLSAPLRCFARRPGRARSTPAAEC